MSPPLPLRPARVDYAKPVLLAVIDTEEDRGWGSYRREDTCVGSMSQAYRAQRLFEQYKIHPTWVADYPVVSQPDGYQPLREFSASGVASVGAHCHPWVNPPFDETITRRNTFPGNLDAPLEQAKLRVLTETIEANIGARPVAYKAGRYGIGANTPAILEQLGYEVDLSLSPPYDFTNEDGPDFSRCSPNAQWLGARLLAIPNTGAYVGFLHACGQWLHAVVNHPGILWTHAGGILARGRALERIRLSPEGFEFAEHVRLTRALLARGVRVFTWSLHSPSLQAGGSPYVRSETELTRFLDSFRRYFDFFFGELGGVSMTPLEVKKLAGPAPASAL